MTTTLQYNHYNWNIPIGYTLAPDISIPESASVQYFTSHGLQVPPGGESEKLLLNAMINQFGRERYARANTYDNLPTYASTTGLGNYSFSYNFQISGNPFTGLTLEAYALGQSDAYYGAWNRGYGIPLALVYKIVKFRLGRNDIFRENGETFDNTHLTRLSDKCKDVLTEFLKYDKGLQRANFNIQPEVQHIITEPILDEITGTNNTNIVGGAGGYLGSSWTLHGIITMLDILGTDEIVTPNIKQKLKTIIRREILLIIKNWKKYLSWYVNGNQTNTNQAIEPIGGLIQGCLYLEEQNLLPAYEVGTTILRDSFNRGGGFGASGAFAEGYGYAYSTTPAIHRTLRLIRNTGDTSLNASSANWIENNWKWMVDHIMPGNLVANYSDNSNPKLQPWLTNSPHPSVSAAAVAASVVNGVVTNYQPLKNLNAIYPNAVPIEMEQLEWYDLSKLPGSSTNGLIALPNFVHYKDSALVIWRSIRDVIKDVADDSAGIKTFGIWIKGSTVLDGHVHRDAGQISVNVGKKIILMDSGSNYNYSPQDNLRGPQGHSILQIDTIPNTYPVYAGWTGCPITVNQLGATSGNVNINLLGAYIGPAVTHPELSPQQITDYQAGKISDISRGITWHYTGSSIAGTLNITIKDGVTFTQSVGGEHYRWHTGSTAIIGGPGFTITQNGSVWTAKWAGVTMTISPSRAITVTGITGPDATQETGMISAHNILKITPQVSGLTFSVTTVINSVA